MLSKEPTVEQVAQQLGEAYDEAIHIAACARCGKPEYSVGCPLCESAKRIMEDKQPPTNQDVAILMTEAVNKSIRERMNRHVRRTAGPTCPTPVNKGVVRRLGRNDPPRQSKGRRYAAGTAAKEEQNQDQRDAHAAHAAPAEPPRRTLARVVQEQRLSRLRAARQQARALQEEVKECVQDARVVSLLREVCATGAGHANSDIQEQALRVVRNLQDIPAGPLALDFANPDADLDWNPENAHGWSQLIVADRALAAGQAAPSDR
jgi:hypothetical protein